MGMPWLPCVICLVNVSTRPCVVEACPRSSFASSSPDTEGSSVDVDTKDTLCLTTAAAAAAAASWGYILLCGRRGRCRRWFVVEKAVTSSGLKCLGLINMGTINVPVAAIMTIATRTIFQRL